MYELSFLHILQARDNQIETLDVGPSGLGALRCLSTLDLSNNNVGHIPVELGLIESIV